MPPSKPFDKPPLRVILFFSLFSGLFLLYSLMGAARFPNSWSATQMVWSYHAGFIKRGLMGEVLRLGFGTISYHLVIYCSFLILFLELALWLGWSGRLAGKVPGGLLLAVFFLSPAMTFLIHSVGYMDHLLLIIAIVIALIPLHHKYATPVIALLCLSGELLHELFFVLAVPVLWLRLLLAGLPCEGNIDKKPLRSFAGLLGLNLALALFLCQSHFIPGTADANAFLCDAGEHADFPLNAGTMRVATRTLADNRDLNLLGHPGLLPAITEKVRIHGVAYAPVWGLYMLITLLVLLAPRRALPARVQAALAISVALSTLLPAATMLIAWDYSRLFALSATVSYLLCLTALQHTPRERLPSLNRTPLWLLAATVLLWNITHHPWLMDGLKVAPFPFADQWQSLRDLLTWEAALPAIPPY